jgi:hypothetical protein
MIVSISTSNLFFLILVRKNRSTKAIKPLESNEEAVYNSLHSNQFALPKLESFTEALKGFYLLKEKD